MKVIHLQYKRISYFYPGFYNRDVSDRRLPLKVNEIMFLWHREEGPTINIKFLLSHPRWRKFGYRTHG